MTGDFSRRSFYYYFLESFWSILNLFSCNLNTFTKHTEQICFLFICLFFTCCFLTILCINTFHLFVLFHCVYIHRMSLFSLCLFFCNHSVYKCSQPFVLFTLPAVQKRKVKALIWPGIHFWISINVWIWINYLFVSLC